MFVSQSRECSYASLSHGIIIGSLGRFGGYRTMSRGGP
jgi:hypothetical protein